MSTPIEIAIMSAHTEIKWHRSELESNLDQVKRLANGVADRLRTGTVIEELNLTKFAGAVERHTASIATLRDCIRSLEAIRDAKEVY